MSLRGRRSAAVRVCRGGPWSPRWRASVARSRPLFVRSGRCLSSAYSDPATTSTPSTRPRGHHRHDDHLTTSPTTTRRTPRDPLQSGPSLGRLPRRVGVSTFSVHDVHLLSTIFRRFVDTVCAGGRVLVHDVHLFLEDLSYISDSSVSRVGPTSRTPTPAPCPLRRDRFAWKRWTSWTTVLLPAQIPPPDSGKMVDTSWTERWTPHDRGRWDHPDRTPTPVRRRWTRDPSGTPAWRCRGSRAVPMSRPRGRGSCHVGVRVILGRCKQKHGTRWGRSQPQASR